MGAVDHIGFSVRDLGASRRFFSEVLGFELVNGDPDYPAAFLDNGQAFITLWQIDEPDDAPEFDRKKYVGLHHIALDVDSFAALDNLHDQISRFPGARIEFAPEPAYGGPRKHMMVRDPSGLRIELGHTPPRPGK